MSERTAVYAWISIGTIFLSLIIMTIFISARFSRQDKVINRKADTLYVKTLAISKSEEIMNGINDMKKMQRTINSKLDSLKLGRW
jgi:hypothetical protein